MEFQEFLNSELGSGLVALFGGLVFFAMAMQLYYKSKKGLREAMDGDN